MLFKPLRIAGCSAVRWDKRTPGSSWESRGFSFGYPQNLWTSLWEQGEKARKHVDRRHCTRIGRLRDGTYGRAKAVETAGFASPHPFRTRLTKREESYSNAVACNDGRL